MRHAAATKIVSGTVTAQYTQKRSEIVFSGVGVALASALALMDRALFARSAAACCEPESICQLNMPVLKIAAMYVPGRKSIVRKARVFMAALSRLEEAA